MVDECIRVFVVNICEYSLKYVAKCYTSLCKYFLNIKLRFQYRELASDLQRSLEHVPLVLTNSTDQTLHLYLAFHDNESEQAIEVAIQLGCYEKETLAEQKYFQRVHLNPRQESHTFK